MQGAKRHVVDMIEATCALLDRIPWTYKTDDGWRVFRYGQIGCVLGVARIAAKLDDRWSTGHFVDAGRATSSI